MDMQVLFSEQVKMRTAMRGKDQIASGNNSEQEAGQTTTETDIIALKTELENVKANMAELQRDYSQLQQEYEKLNNHQRNRWSINWEKIRRASLFNTKTDGDESSEGRQRSNPLSKISFTRRRQSMA